MKFFLYVFGLTLALPMAAQQSSSTPATLELSLRCTGVETAPQSRVVKSAAYGFGNPTNPEDDEFTKHIDRIVLIEVHGTSGRIHLPKAVLAVTDTPVSEGWFPLDQIGASPDVITAKVKLTASGQSLRIDRRTGAAELSGYGSHPLRGVCRIDRKPQQF